MTSLGFSVLFSNTRRFLAVQIHQQTHVKMLTDTPVGGRQVSAEEVPRACSKVLVGWRSKANMVGRLLHTLLVKLQWRKRWSAYSGAPHRAHVTGWVKMPRRCRAILSGKASCTIFHINTWIFGAVFTPHMFLIQLKFWRRFLCAFVAWCCSASSWSCCLTASK